MCVLGSLFVGVVWRIGGCECDVLGFVVGGDDVARAVVLENLGAWGAEWDVRGDVVGGCINAVWSFGNCLRNFTSRVSVWSG